MAYYLDSNVFIEASRRYYGFDFCPAFWDWLLAQNDAGKVFSVQAVAHELAGSNDKLQKWAAKRGEKLFVPPEEHVEPWLEQVQEWVGSQNYEPSAMTEFLESADHYLVAQALADNYYVVTHEVPAETRRRIKIPNVCNAFRIKYLSLFDMLRNEKAKFVLAG